MHDVYFRPVVGLGVCVLVGSCVVCVNTATVTGVCVLYALAN